MLNCQIIIIKGYLRSLPKPVLQSLYQKLVATKSFMFYVKIASSQFMHISVWEWGFLVGLNKAKKKIYVCFRFPDPI